MGRLAAMATPGPLGLTLDALGEALGAASTVLRANAMAAGLDAPVPTCPDWTVLDLVAHQGMVHRWAASHLRGEPIDPPEPLEREGRESADVLGWFDDGATALLQAIVDAPDDLDALVFLEDAPAPRLFWARRQCHETTIHAVDALGARLGRPARADETWIKPAVALDGIDELLVGFVTRRRKGASPGSPTRLLVRPDERGRRMARRPRAGSADLHPAGRTRLPRGGRRRPRPHRRPGRPLPAPVEPQRHRAGRRARALVARHDLRHLVIPDAAP